MYLIHISITTYVLHVCKYITYVSIHTPLTSLYCLELLTVVEYVDLRCYSSWTYCCPIINRLDLIAKQDLNDVKFCPCDLQCGTHPWKHCSSSLSTGYSYYSLSFLISHHMYLSSNLKVIEGCLAFSWKSHQGPWSECYLHPRHKFNIQPTKPKCRNLSSHFGLILWQREKNVKCIIWFYIHLNLFCNVSKVV